MGVKTRKDLEIHLITRALKDEDFKRELIANPKAVIEEELETKLPEDLEIKVLEETEDTIYMVLPCNPYEGMSEEELQASLGMTYEDVAQWVLEQQKNTLLDEESSVILLLHIWKDQDYKQKLILDSKTVLEQKFNTNISKNITIKSLEETPQKLFIVIPEMGDKSVPRMTEWFDDIKSERKQQPLFEKISVGYCGSSFEMGSSCTT
ncbi:MAG: NHLP leader peptide family RiPP precursor [Okeania sp.]|nr:NHLP leader peptide family RiPP precursor [Okeania sp.]